MNDNLNGTETEPVIVKLPCVFTSKIFAHLVTLTGVAPVAPALAMMDLLMRQVAARALELDDKALHKLMLQLGLYAVADPNCPEYDGLLVQRILSE